MKKKLIWRLKNLPSAESLQGLFSSGILTKDEVREILFSKEIEEKMDESEYDLKTLKD